jgi:hypothetical protein
MLLAAVKALHAVLHKAGTCPVVQEVLAPTGVSLLLSCRRVHRQLVIDVRSATDNRACSS